MNCKQSYAPLVGPVLLGAVIGILFVLLFAAVLLDSPIHLSIE